MKVSVLILFLAVMYSCSMSSEKYLQTYRTHVYQKELLSSGVHDGLKYELQVFPPSIQRIQSQKHSEISPRQLSMIRLRISNEAHRGLEFFHLDSESMDFDSRIKYYSSAFSKDIQIENDQKELSIVDFHFEQNFNLKPETDFFFYADLESDKNYQIHIVNKPYSMDTVVLSILATGMNYDQKIKI